jgi:L-ascorbate metabolism protein UlaG (beta-lactamase superfamily)
MSPFAWSLCLLLAAVPLVAAAQAKPCPDVVTTSAGDLKIRPVGHGSLWFEFGARVIHVDPYGAAGDYPALPKADLILVTHGHGDHLDPQALAAVKKPGTVVIASRACAGRVPGAVIMANGEAKTVLGLPIEAVPAYNVAHKRPDGTPFHPQGEGNGYVITFGDKRVYVAGDTEFIPEMKALGPVEVAFLPVMLPYTMSVDMAVEAVKTIRPKIFYPYHTGETNLPPLLDRLKKESGLEVRLREFR